MRRIQEVSHYLRFLADHLRLKDWAFEVIYDPELEFSLCTVQCVSNRRMAVIAIGPLFFASSPFDQRHGAVHELVHCHLQPARTFFSTLCGPHGAVHEALRQNHDNHLESATDDLATALAAALPLPTDFKKRREQKNPDD